MIKLKTSEGETIWVAPDKVVVLSAVKSQGQGGGPPVVMLGLTMLIMAGAPPVVVKGSPDEIATRLDNGGLLPA
jgi:hypothetical protein